MKITAYKKEYDVIGEYETYYLCTYKGLYKTCFLKWDVENDRLVGRQGAIGYCRNSKAANSLKDKKARFRCKQGWQAM